MAIISNILETIVRVRDAARSARDIDNVTRATNRLGNASASSGRQFAAQAQGAGALVGAYAGAAANIFALQQAFSALSRASRLEQTVAGVNTLAASIGEAGPRILASIQDITKGQLTLAESAQTLNLALSSGFNSDQIERISTVALKASRALGRDLQDSFTRLVRGAAKLEPELLDELGIFARIEPAAQAYALANNKVASSLTRVEKQQAFVNAVITEGERKFKDINTTVPTASESLEQFGTSIINAATEVGLFLAQSLQPFFQFFTQNVGAQLGAVGLLAGQVVGPAIGLLGGKFEQATNSLRRFAVVSERVGAEFTQADRASRERIQTAFSNITVTNAGSAALNNQLKVLREAARDNNLTTRQINENIGALRAQRTQLLERVRVIRQDIITTQAAGQSTEQLTRRLAQLQGFLIANRRATQAAALSTRSLAASFGVAAASAASFAASTIAFAGRLVTGFLGIITTLITIISLFTIFGSTIAKAVGKGEEFNQLLKDIGAGLKQFLGFDKAAQSAKQAFNSAAASAVNANKELRTINEFTFNTKVLDVDVVVTRNKEDIVNEIVGIQQEADRLINQKVDKVATAGGAAIGGVIGGAIGGTVGTFVGAGVLSALTGPAGVAIGTAVGAAIGGGITAYFSTELPKAAEIKRGFEKLGLQDLLVGKDLANKEVRATAAATLETLSNIQGTSASAELFRRTIAETAFGLRENADEIKRIQKFSEATGVPFANLEKNIDDIDKKLQDLELPTDFINKLNKFNESLFTDTEGKSLLKKEDVEGSKIAENIENTANIVKTGLLPSINNLVVEGLLFGSSIEAINNQLVISTDLATKFEEDLNKGFSSSEALTSSFIAQNTSLDNIVKNIREAEEAYKTTNSTIESITNQINSAQNLTKQGKSTLNDRLEVLFIELGLNQNILDNLRAQLAVERKLLKDREEAAKIQEASLKRNERLQATFSSEIKNAEKLNGIFNSNGKFASSELEIRRNQLQLLTDTFEKTSDAASAQENYTAAVKQIPGFLALTNSEQQAILGATKSTFDQIVDGIAPLKNVNVLTAKSLALTGDQAVLLRERNTAQLAFEGSLQKIVIEIKKFNKELEDTTRKINQASEVATLQNTLKILQVDEQVRQKRADLAQKSLELSNKETDIIDEQRKLQEDIAASRTKSILDAEKALLASNVLGKAFTEDQKRDFEVKFAKADFEEFKRLTERQISDRNEQLRKDQNNLTTEIANRAETLRAQSSQLAVEQQLAQTQLEGQKVDALANLKNLELRAELIDQEREMLSKFIQSFGEVIARTIAIANNPTASDTQIDSIASDIFDGFKIQIDSAFGNTSTVGKFKNSIRGLVDTIERDYAGRIETSNAVFQTRIDLIDEELAALNIEEEKRRKLLNDRAALEDAKNRAEIKERQRALNNLIELAKREGDTLQRIGAELADSLSNRLGEGLRDLFDAIAEGTLTIEGFKEGFKQFLFDILNNIRKTVLEETLIKPVTNFAKQSIAGVFGLSIGEGIESAKVIGGALLVQDVSATSLAKEVGDVGDALTNSVKEGGEASGGIIESFFTKLKDGFSPFFDFLDQGFTNVKGILSNIFTGGESGGGIFGAIGNIGSKLFSSVAGESGILSSVGSGLSSLFRGITGFFATTGGLVPKHMSMATGGEVPVKMATGGMLRDRIPALLEPGEFVIRRTAASALGAPALNAMNATGNMPGNVVINIENKGTPQEAQSSQPRFDGEKFVIDIVTRDIRNNGPIRKTLRGNI